MTLDPKRWEGHTCGPWHTCRDSQCSCFTVMGTDHPVAQITNGEWGDDFPDIRYEDGKPEAYLRQITYGEVQLEMARANWRLIADAPALAATYVAQRAEIEKLRAALEFYASPEIYKLHPHGPAFDDRDLSFHARAALSGDAS